MSIHYIHFQTENRILNKHIKRRKVNKALYGMTTVSGTPLGCYEMKPSQFVWQKGVIFVPWASRWVTVYTQWHLLRSPKLNISLYSLVSSFVCLFSLSHSASLQSKNNRLMKTAKSLSATQEISLCYQCTCPQTISQQLKKAANPTEIRAITSLYKTAQTFGISGPAISSANAALDLTDHSDSARFNNEESKNYAEASDLHSH